MKLNDPSALLALLVEEHYVHVITMKREEKLLMRQSGAIRDVGTIEGLQVHRSHRGATATPGRSRRDGDRAILSLQTNTEIRVSRANRAAIPVAGFLSQ